jgi:predicted PurR-regulated permease PerM
MEKLLEKLQGFVLDTDLLGNVWGFISNLFSSVVNFVLGLFIAFYLLTSKEKRLAQIRKFRAAYMTDRQDSKIGEIVTLVDKTFGGFFKGVLLDAVIVGILMFVALSIFRVSEYNLLIATICAITNVIPVFGPLIGAIPSGLIILFTNPEKLLLFIILVLIIQQLDGNVLVPLIQGNNTGISSLAVLISITVMGGLFGMVGMIIGVPVFAVIIELCKRAIEDKLRKQNKDTDTTHYYRKGAIGNAEEEVYYEHAHWKYKYDHSRIKPHVDKVLAAMMRIGKKNDTADAPAGDAPVYETDPHEADVPAEEVPAAVASDASADESADGQ